MNNVNGQIREGFMPDGNYPQNTSFVTKEYLSGLTMSPNQKGAYELYEEASGNYRAKEAITSAYVRYDQKLWNKLDLVFGLRMEHTSLNYSGFNWVVDNLEDEQGHLESTGDKKNSYINWLPSVLLKYNATDDLKLRAFIYQDPLSSKVLGIGSLHSL